MPECEPKALPNRLLLRILERDLPFQGPRSPGNPSGLLLGLLNFSCLRLLSLRRLRPPRGLLMAHLGRFPYSCRAPLGPSYVGAASLTSFLDSSWGSWRFSWPLLTSLGRLLGIPDLLSWLLDHPRCPHMPPTKKCQMIFMYHRRMSMQYHDACHHNKVSDTGRISPRYPTNTGVNADSLMIPELT